MKRKRSVSIIAIICCVLATFPQGIDAGPIGEEYIVGHLLSAASSTIQASSWSKCILCKATIGIVNEFFTQGKSEESLVSTLMFACKTFHIETAAVCEGIIPLFKDMLIQVIAKSPLSAHDICSLAFDQQCGEPTQKSNWTVPTSGVPKPPLQPVPVPAETAPKLRIAHLADTHVDEEYSPGTIVDCADPLCCRPNSTPKSGHGVENTRAGFWGSFMRCDIPERTLISALKHIGQTVKPDYLYFTGDIMPHNVWQTTREENLRQFNRTLQLLSTHLPGVKVIPAMGNHEGVPVNSFPIPQITGDLSIKWLYEALADVWSFYIPQENLKPFREGGYFSYDINPRLRVISLNMNYGNAFNWWVLINSTDPTGHLRWLTAQLQECEDKGIKVHLIGHHPPGQSDIFSVWSENFNKIVNRYEATITGQFYGHTHFDEFAVFFDEANATRPFGVAYVAPSITTFNSGEPSVRVYHIDGDYNNSTYQVLDFETHSMDLELANQFPSDDYEPEWDVIPSIKDHYKLSSLQPSGWAEYAKRLVKDDAAFKDFFTMYMKRAPGVSYTATDRQDILCRLVTTVAGKECHL